MVAADRRGVAGEVVDRLGVAVVVDRRGVVGEAVDNKGVVEEAVDKQGVVEEAVDKQGVVEEAVDKQGVVEEAVDKQGVAYIAEGEVPDWYIPGEAEVFDIGAQVGSWVEDWGSVGRALMQWADSGRVMAAVEGLGACSSGVLECHIPGMGLVQCLHSSHCCRQ